MAEKLKTNIMLIDRGQKWLHTAQSVLEGVGHFIL